MSTTRRRGPELEAALHAAVLEEVDERGYSGATYDGVAARAATSKQVLYRRWRTKAEMVMAAVLSSRFEAIVVPDSGSISQDLISLLQSVRDNFASPRRGAMFSLLGDLDHEDAEAMRTMLFSRGAETVLPTVEHARARHELGHGLIPSAVLALPLDLARHELALRGDLPQDRIETIVETIVVPLLIHYSFAGEPSTAQPTEPATP